MSCAIRLWICINRTEYFCVARTVHAEVLHVQLVWELVSAGIESLALAPGDPCPAKYTFLVIGAGDFERDGPIDSGITSSGLPCGVWRRMQDRV